MKWFYFTSLGVVCLLALTPYVLLDPPESGQLAGKVVTYNIYSAKVKSIDPATCGDTTSAGIQGSIYEGLYCYHYLKRPLEVIPQLADGMPEISADGLTWTIKIKKGVKYARNPCFGLEADGRPRTRTVTAGDFVLGFKRIADYHMTSQLAMAFVHDTIEGVKDYRQRTRKYAKGDLSRYDKEEISGVKALDEHTLQIRLARVFPQFQYVLAINTYAPIAREIIPYYLERKRGKEPIRMSERVPEIHDFKAAVGTGPYVMTDWVKAGRIVLERNPDFRPVFYPREGAPGDKEAGLLEDAGRRVPFIDVVHLVFVKENNTAWGMFEKMQRDSAGIPRDVYGDVISPEKALLQEWRDRGIKLIKDTYPAVFWIAFNMEDPVVGQSKSLRQALCLAYDVESHIDILFNGRGKRATNTIPSSTKGHEKAGPSPYARFDLRLARKKLNQAKQELAAKGVIASGGDIPELTLSLPGRDEEDRRFGIFAQRQFAKLGIKLQIDLNDWPTLQKKVHNKQAQLYAMGWHADYPDAENFLQLYYSPNITRGTNNTNYANHEFDKLFEKASKELDEQKRIELYAKMTRIINEDCPVLLLSEPITYYLHYEWVKNIKLHPIGYGFRKFTRIDDEMRRRAKQRQKEGR
ncbi:MAG: ABC transporter substrate-binding protein [Planctomycetota bacterium]|jgi:ABC-type transport system substrate-binding protein